MTDISSTSSAGQDENQSNNFEPLKQFVTFLVENRPYGIDINLVREIKQWTPTTQLPNQDIFTRGVLNLRGTIVPVNDLRARFNGVQTTATENHVVVIVWIGSKTVGILVDAVSDIISVTPDEIRTVPSQKSAGDQAIVSGLVNCNDEMVALIDPNVLFPTEENKSEE